MVYGDVKDLSSRCVAARTSSVVTSHPTDGLTDLSREEATTENRRNHDERATNCL